MLYAVFGGAGCAHEAASIPWFPGQQSVGACGTRACLLGTVAARYALVLPYADLAAVLYTRFLWSVASSTALISSAVSIGQHTFLFFAVLVIRSSRERNPIPLVQIPNLHRFIHNVSYR